VGRLWSWDAARLHHDVEGWKEKRGKRGKKAKICAKCIQTFEAEMF